MTPMIDRDSPIPLYYQLKLHFKQQMDDGDLQPGDRLPTEMELCEQFHISRAPVRQALTELAREGLIYRRAGQGSFVAPAVKSLVEKTKVKVLAHYDVRWMASLEQAVLNWNELHREHEVELDVSMCGRENFHRMLRRLAIQGEAPDIAPMDYVWIHHYASEGYIAPLDELDSDWVTQLKTDLEAPVLGNNSVNGQLYGVPVQADISGLWYRKDWFEAEGIDVPATWEQWLGAIDYFSSAASMRRWGHRYPVVLPVASVTGEATLNLLIAFIWMAGGNIVDDAGELSLRRECDQICTALRFLQEITVRRRSLLPTDMHRTQWWDLARFFAEGDVAMTLGGSYEWPRIREESDWDDEADVVEHLGFTLLPRPSVDVTPVGSLGGTSWAIFRQSPVQELCAEILKLMATDEVSTAFCEENLQISPYVSSNRRLMGPDHPWLTELIPLVERARSRPLVPYYLRLSSLLQDMFERVLWDGADPRSAVLEAAQMLTLVSSTPLL